MTLFRKHHVIALISIIATIVPSQAQQRSMQEVLDIITAAGQPAIQNSLKSKSFGDNVASLLPSSQLTKQPSTSGQDEAFYVYSPGQNQGFVIVSADKRMSPVLGYASKGDFNINEMPDNVKAWLQSYVAEAQALSNTIGGNVKEQTIIPAAEGEVGPLIATKWDQRYPYNLHCPYYDGTNQAVTGCVATSMAQIMYYYKWPTTGMGSNSYTSSSYKLPLSRDFSSITFKWELMKESYTGITLNKQEEDAIAELMYTCGISVNMDYGPSSGSSQINQMHALAKNFGYDADMAAIQKDLMPINDWHAALQAEINAQRPVLISGTTAQGNAHAFIIDGYTPDPADEYPYYHINWGWGGQLDANFKMHNMSDTGDPKDAYTQALSALINLQPDNNIEDFPHLIQLGGIGLSSTNIDLTNGEKLDIDLDRLINCSNKAFSGTFTVYLIDNANQRTPIKTLAINDMLTNMYISGSQNCNIPSALESGEYTIAIYAQSNGSIEEYLVPIGNPVESITITNDASIYYPQIMATDITTSIATSAPRDITLTATGILNYADLAFSGTLQMMICDYYGKRLANFGSTRSINGLGKFNYYSNPFTFSGTLPSDISDGAYKCYLAANQNEYNGWGKVSKYVIEGGYITQVGIEAGQKLWIKDGAVTFNMPYVQGDVNNDYTINVADLSAMVRLILDNHQVRDFTFYASDMNEDATLNVGDFSILASNIIGAAGKRAASSKSLPGSIVAAENIISLDAMQISDDEYQIDINLNNSHEAFNALQFDLNLPQGVTLTHSNISLTNRTKGFKTIVGNDRVLICNLSDADITENNGPVARFNIKVATQSEPSVGLSNIIASNSKNCEAICLSDVALSGEELTGISQTCAADGLNIKTVGNSVILTSQKPCVATIVNVNGQFVANISLGAGESREVNLAPGVYAINNNKVIIK